MEKFKLTRNERNWILYDVGNSAFTLIVSTIVPIYFNYLAEKANITSVDYLAYWGYAASAATLIVAVLGPILGTLTDTKGFKKLIFTISVIVGAAGCILMGFAKEWFLFLVIFLIAKVGFSASLIFYDSMLTDVTSDERMDSVSSQGYAWGYIGSCIPFVVCLILVLFGKNTEMSMAISFALVAVWWILMTIPLLKTYKQKHYVERREHAVSESFKRLGKTFSEIKSEKKLLFFILAFFFYIDGVYTIIDMATAYGSALGLDSTGLLLALLATQIVAFPSAIIFGKLSGKFKTHELIFVCIIAYCMASIFSIFLKYQWQFWVLAVFVGMFQGGIQALSRSYFAKIIPQDKSGEYFGILDICGKGASFMGTTIVSAASQISGSMNLGVGMIAILLITGLILFKVSADTPINDNAPKSNKNISESQIKESVV